MEVLIVGLHYKSNLYLQSGVIFLDKQQPGPDEGCSPDILVT